MIVADTMLIAYALLEHPRFAEGVERVKNKDAVWAAPSLWRSELRNVFIKYVRSTDPASSGSGLTLDGAVARMHAAEALLAGRTHDVDSEAVMRLASASGCSAYDCEYVALAQERGVKLVTYDQPVLRAFLGTAMHPQDFA